MLISGVDHAAHTRPLLEISTSLSQTEISISERWQNEKL